MPIGIRVIGEQNFTHNRNARTASGIQGNLFKISYKTLHAVAECPVITLPHYGRKNAQPVGCPVFCVTGAPFIGLGKKRKALQHVSPEHAKQHAVEHAAAGPETGMSLCSRGAQGKDGDRIHAVFQQRLA